MAQTIQYIGGTSFLRTAADDTADTFALEWWNGSTWAVLFSSSTNGNFNPAGGITEPTQFAALAASYGTTSTTAVSTGAGVTITPTGTRVEIDGHAVAQNNTASDGWTLAIYRTTGSIPAQGSAPGGSDAVVYQTTRTVSSANQNFNSGWQFVDSGLTVGAAYGYYITIAAVTGGTATVVGGTNQTTIIARNT